MLWLFLCVLLQLAASSPVQSNTSDNRFYSLDYYPTVQGGRIAGVWQDAYAKARDVVSKMTITEKVNLTTGVGWQNGLCVGNTGAVPRFGIPMLCYQDSPLGIRFGDHVTGFPSGMAAATSFNKDLLKLRGHALGKQFKKKGIHVYLGPVVGPVGYKANGGRFFESFGADPYLQGVAAALTTEGVQSEGVVASVKHFVANEQELYRSAEAENPFTGEITTEPISANIPDRVMHEVFLRPFADTVRSGAGSVMCSYNAVNNTPACENSYVLNYLLKEELGFQGFVVSDWGAQYTGVRSAVSGLDVTMPGNTFNGFGNGASYWGQNLTRAVYNGTVPLSRLDDMATRVLAALYASNAMPAEDEITNFSSWTEEKYDHEYYLDDNTPMVVVNHFVPTVTSFTDSVALSGAEEGVVLLKNSNGTLPIDDDLKSLLLSGYGAGPDPEGLMCFDHKCTDGALFQGWGSGTAKGTWAVTPFEGIAQIAKEKRIEFDFVRDSYDFTEQQRIASWVDMAIVVVTAAGGEGYITVDGNYGDRKNFTLWNNGEELIEKITAVCSNVVVVITSNGPVEVEKFVDNKNVTAILWTGPSGDNYGTALANVLFGKSNVNGKLPFTFAKNSSEYVPIIKDLPSDLKPQDDTFQDTQLLIDYKHFSEKNVEPRWWFGYGLQYNTYEFTNLQVSVCGSLSRTLPTPNSYLDVHDFGDSASLKDPSEALFPEDLYKVKTFLYPYLEDTNVNSNGTYPYPGNYSTKQPTSPKTPGGGLGGNDALWNKVLNVNVGVKNTGSSKDKFVVQLYCEFPHSDKLPTPTQLCGFEKVTVGPGATVTANLQILWRDLAVWDTTVQSWVLLEGEYKIHVGKSAGDLVLAQSIKV